MILDYLQKLCVLKRQDKTFYKYLLKRCVGGILKLNKKNELVKHLLKSSC